MGEKRYRPPVPTYLKFYSVDKYDRQKFRDLLNEWLATDEGKHRTYATLKRKQIEILRQCYERDDEGKILKDSDEKHIYRVKDLQKIYERIYHYVIIGVRFGNNEIDGLIIDDIEQQAELIGTWRLSVYDRMRVHIALLRMLKYGYTTTEAIDTLKNGKYKLFRKTQREIINKNL